MPFLTKYIPNYLGRIKSTQHISTQHTASAAAAHNSPKPLPTSQVQQASQCNMKPQQSRYSSSDVGGGERHPVRVTDGLYRVYVHLGTGEKMIDLYRAHTAQTTTTAKTGTTTQHTTAYHSTVQHSTAQRLYPKAQPHNTAELAGLYLSPDDCQHVKLCDHGALLVVR